MDFGQSPLVTSTLTFLALLFLCLVAFALVWVLERIDSVAVEQVEATSETDSLDSEVDNEALPSKTMDAALDSTEPTSLNATSPDKEYHPTPQHDDDGTLTCPIQQASHSMSPFSEQT
ncbi:hypothetical protein FRC02_003075 [Tulasnella sp. 418]|nr:hypothetical protein FRC02_003075 [Tulasnella sp. 418]